MHIYTYMNIINNSSVPRKGGQVIYHNVKRVVSFLVLFTRECGRLTPAICVCNSDSFAFAARGHLFYP